ncbi:hypothetical protein [Pacificoceanicola onchidii]|uniref:hypothetical protein n=1 Tax=Pacificoceanicola onchidii TaxID=2562685 RepID=UPI0010A3425F|nr:hypothetical protein [Pacificoceanicola onchidii]
MSGLFDRLAVKAGSGEAALLRPTVEAAHWALPGEDRVEDPLMPDPLPRAEPIEVARYLRKPAPKSEPDRPVTPRHPPLKEKESLPQAAPKLAPVVPASPIPETKTVSQEPEPPAVQRIERVTRETDVRRIETHTQLETAAKAVKEQQQAKEVPKPAVLKPAHAVRTEPSGQRPKPLTSRAEPAPAAVQAKSPPVRVEIGQIVVKAPVIPAQPPAKAPPKSGSSSSAPQSTAQSAGGSSLRSYLGWSR